MKTMLSASRKSLSGLMDKTSGDQVKNSSTLFGFLVDMFYGYIFCNCWTLAINNEICVVPLFMKQSGQ